MDNIFFILSKSLWIFIKPENLLVFSLTIITILFLLKKDHLAKKYFYRTSTIVLLIAFYPVGSWLMSPLETHFPIKPELPKKVDGIILLGGSFIPSKSHKWNKVQTNHYADRIHDFLALTHKYPLAKAVFTGGKADINGSYSTEATLAKKLFSDIGIPKKHVIYEYESRNTYENIINTKKMVHPKKNETWVVISSAFHLPRVVSIFCQQNWNVIPYPADFHTAPTMSLTPSLNLSGNLQQLNKGLHEWIGLIAYYLTGKTDQWLPKKCA